MTDHSIAFGDVDVSLNARAKGHIFLPQILPSPGGIYPLHSSAWEIDEYRIFRGWPVPVPRCEVRANTLVSSVGDVLGAREDATSVTTGASLRWVVDSTLYSQETLRWDPIQGGVSWTTEVAHAPVFLDDYEYTVNKERFFADAINFDSDTGNYMQCDFSSELAGINAYTVIMVVSLNSFFGNEDPVPFSGIWCPTATPSANWVSVTLQGHWLYLETDNMERYKVLSVANQLESSGPAFIAMVFDRPTSSFYAATGPQTIQRAQVYAGEPSEMLDNHVMLGRYGSDFLHTADMAVLDLSIYNSALTRGEVKAEFGLLSRAYGGDR